MDFTLPLTFVTFQRTLESRLNLDSEVTAFAFALTTAAITH